MRSHERGHGALLMKATLTPGHDRRLVAGVLVRRLVVRLFEADPA